jgi:hypothetical protein
MDINAIVAAHHVVDDNIGLVSFGRIVTIGTGVSRTLAKAMSPTVVYFDIANDDSGCSSLGRVAASVVAGAA